MTRVTTLFAVSAIALISAGLIAEYWPAHPDFGITMSSGHATYGFPFSVPCNALAALFCLFAVRYAWVLIPFSLTTAQWHFWLSTVGVILVAAGFLNLGSPRLQAAPGEPLNMLGYMVIGSIVSGVALFVLAQAWFAVSFAHGLLHIQRL